MQFDREKFKTLVLYVIWRTGDVADFGSTKLNKVLWFSDARAFEALGESVTGETYIREKFGPVPKHIQPVLNELLNEKLIQQWMEPYYDFEVSRFRAHGPPDLSRFTPSEMNLIDWWIEHIAQKHTAVSISEKSHDYAWKIAKQGEEIPFRAFLAKRIRAPKEGEELEWATGVAKSLERGSH